MDLFIIIHGTYQDVRLGLFQRHSLLDMSSINNAYASKQLIPTISALLIAHGKELKDLSFIAANQGPGPFTTLRTILTTINGINFATGIPLIGIDTLKGLSQEWPDSSFTHTITLLDAFNNDVYFCINGSHNTPSYTTDNTPTQNNGISDTQYQVGYQPIDTFLLTVSQLKHHIRFIGNGTLLHKEKIEATCGTNAYFPPDVPATCSLPFLSTVALSQWEAQKTSSQLLPLYLKKHHAEKK